MTQGFPHKFYTKHNRLCKKLLSVFVWSFSAKTRIKMILEHPNGIKDFKTQERKLKQQTAKHKITIFSMEGI